MMDKQRLEDLANNLITRGYKPFGFFSCKAIDQKDEVFEDHLVLRPDQDNIIVYDHRYEKLVELVRFFPSMGHDVEWFVGISEFYGNTMRIALCRNRSTKTFRLFGIDQPVFYNLTNDDYVETIYKLVRLSVIFG